jgi:hypothetical protein
LLAALTCLKNYFTHFLIVRIKLPLTQISTELLLSRSVVGLRLLTHEHVDTVADNLSLETQEFCLPWLGPHKASFDVIDVQYCILTARSLKGLNNKTYCNEGSLNKHQMLNCLQSTQSSNPV